MSLGTIWISFVQTCLPQRRRVRRSYRMDAGLEQRALLSAVAGCELNVDVGDEVPDDTVGDATPGEDILSTDTVDIAWCGAVDLPADGNITEDLTPVDCDNLNPVDPVVELETKLDGSDDTEVNPMVIRCFDLNPDALNAVDPVIDDAGGDVPTDPVAEDPVDPANPDVPTDPVDNPDVIFYSLGGGGRGTDDNGNIQPNFRGNNQQSRHDRRQARNQEKTSRKADRQATIQQKKSNRPARNAGRRHR